jgi:hypothetical protein
VTTFLQILAAYILADLFSGLYHLATDKGFNTRDQIEMFQEHHDTNTMAGFDWQTFAVGMPFVGVGAWFHSVFTIALGCFIALTQVTHYYAHKNSRSKLAHHFIRILQITHVIVPPESHAAHHQPPHSRDFCLLSGWNNWWLNRAIGLWEGVQ